MSNNYNKLLSKDPIRKTDIAHYLCTTYNGIDLTILFEWIWDEKKNISIDEAKELINIFKKKSELKKEVFNKKLTNFKSKNILIVRGVSSNKLEQEAASVTMLNKQQERSKKEKEENDELISKADNEGNLNSVITHIKRRFFYLSEYLKNNPTAKVVIPWDGQDEGFCLARCGESIAKREWENIDPDKYNKLINTITYEIEQLQKNYRGRFSKGKVGGDSISANNIHVWGANVGNWNLPENKDIPGAGQASYMDKQRPGVYGIVTMPTVDKELASILDVKPINWEINPSKLSKKVLHLEVTLSK